MRASAVVDWEAGGAMGFETVGFLHPGEMGAAIGAALVASGRTVWWASSGRRPASAARAEAAGLSDAGTVAELVRRCDLVVSVCPPHAALEVARAVAVATGAGCTATGITGCYLDANAVAPSTARQVAAVVTAGGGRYVDGGIIGLPPAPGRACHLYLSGDEAAEVAAVFADTPVVARVLAGAPWAASAVKMCYAAWTKGSIALLLGVRALATAEGVEEALLEEWAESQPELAARSLQAARQAARKGWRWVGEMEEIAETFRAAGLPDGFHAAAADLFRRPARDEGAGADEAALRAIVTTLVTGAPPTVTA